MLAAEVMTQTLCGAQSHIVPSLPPLHVLRRKDRHLHKSCSCGPDN